MAAVAPNLSKRWATQTIHVFHRVNLKRDPVSLTGQSLSTLLAKLNGYPPLRLTFRIHLRHAKCSLGLFPEKNGES